MTAAPGRAPATPDGDGRATATPPPARYRLLVRLLSPLLLAHLLWRASRDGGARYLRERLGLGTPSRRDAAEGPFTETPSAGGPGPRPERLWVHAASVGEVVTVLPLLEAMLDGAPPPSVVVTTNTPTGAAVLERRAPPAVRHRYLPIDLPGATRRFLERERPDRGWIVETEIWPWLYARCRARGVPLAILNARLSPRTARHARGPLAPVYARALAGVDVLARSAEDASGYRALGAEPARTHVVGELKFAAPAPGAPAPDAPLDRPYALAASTHHDEEERLGRAWLDRDEGGLLVVVPRHPERGAALARRLPACARRSLGERPGAADRLYLADTLGELDAWYAHARGAFVGGSLSGPGGHNVLEPARHGCPIVVGPRTANFVEPVRALREAAAIAELDDAGAVAAFLARALAGDPALIEQGARGRDVASARAAIAGRYLELLGRARPGRPERPERPA